jgi:hypothetical protein
MNILRPTTGRAEVLGADSRRLGLAEFALIGYVSENQEMTTSRSSPIDVPGEVTAIECGNDLLVLVSPPVAPAVDTLENRCGKNVVASRRADARRSLCAMSGEGTAPLSPHPYGPFGEDELYILAANKTLYERLVDLLNWSISSITGISNPVLSFPQPLVDKVVQGGSHTLDNLRGVTKEENL